LNNEARCKTDSCTEVDDVANCCVDLPSCDSYSCNSTQILIQNASRTYCSSGECQAFVCCVDRASCTGFQYCGEDQQLNNEAKCKADSCTEVDDVASCCVDVASCDSYSCSSIEILIKNASRKYCASDECQAVDCCEAKANCSTYECEIGDQRVTGYCADTFCTSSDYDTCCSKTIGGSSESSSEGLSIGIIIVIAVGAVLIIGGVIVAVYKHNQRKKSGFREKQFIEM